MKKLSWTLVCKLSCVLLLGTLASAHGNMEHILGTVVEIKDHSLSVKTTDGAVKTIDFDDQTKFLKGDSPVTVKEVQVGSRVAIHAQKHDNSLHASEVKIGTNAARSQH